jgi:hypothetical protein
MCGGAIAQRWPDDQVHEQADGDADAGVEQPREQHRSVIGVAGREDDGRRRGRRGGLIVPPAQPARDESGEHNRADRDGADPEQAARGKRDQAPKTLVATCCTPRRTVPNTVACTVSSAAHGARNCCDRWNTWTATTYAITAARAVLASCAASAHATGSASLARMVALYPSRHRSTAAPEP